MLPLLRLLLLQVALLRHAMGILATGSDPAAAAAGKGRQWATRTSLCNLSCCNLATLHEVCSGFGLGVAASFRLIAQSHLGPCWSWSSATHPLLCACSLLTLVHSPQCHSRSSYRPPEASPAGQREVTPPRRCRLASCLWVPTCGQFQVHCRRRPVGRPPRSSLVCFRLHRAMGSQEMARISHAEQGNTGAMGGGTRFRMVLHPTWLFMCGSQGARLPLQRPHQSESRTRLQPYNSSDRTAATTIPVWHTALAVGRIVDPRFPSFQKPAALVVGRPVVLAHDPLHAASLERTQRPLRHPRGRAVTGRRNCSRETDSRIAGGGRLVGPARATHSFPPGALLHPYSFLRLDQTTAASVTMPR